ERAPEDQTVRLRHGEGVGGRAINRDILEIAGPDMPFLVDSVMGELAEQGIAALAMFHPVAPAASGAGRDSLIEIHLPRLSSAQARAVHEGVRASLADVRASVGDFQAMRARMKKCAEELKAARCNAPEEEIDEAAELLRWLAADKFTFLGA